MRRCGGAAAGGGKRGRRGAPAESVRQLPERAARLLLQPRHTLRLSPSQGDIISPPKTTRKRKGGAGGGRCVLGFRPRRRASPPLSPGVRSTGRQQLGEAVFLFGGLPLRDGFEAPGLFVASGQHYVEVAPKMELASEIGVL